MEFKPLILNEVRPVEAEVSFHEKLVPSAFSVMAVPFSMSRLTLIELSPETIVVKVGVTVIK